MNTEKETVRRVHKHSKDKSKKVDRYMSIPRVVTNHCLQIDNVYQITATFIQKYSRINHGESLRNIMWQMELLYCLLCTVPYACAHMSHAHVYVYALLCAPCNEVLTNFINAGMRTRLLCSRIALHNCSPLPPGRHGVFSHVACNGRSW